MYDEKCDWNAYESNDISTEILNPNLNTQTVNLKNVIQVTLTIFLTQDTIMAILKIELYKPY
jgi:hypothetical protein